MRKSDRSLILVLAIPFLLSIFAAIYAYIEFSSNGLFPPNLWIVTLLFAVLTFSLYMLFVCQFTFGGIKKEK